MAFSWWGKGLWQIGMHHWTVHAKVEFPRFLTDVRTAGVHSTTFDPELRNKCFALISFMGFPAILSALQPCQICIYNTKKSKLTLSNGSQLMGKRFVANLHESLDSTCKSRISKISTRCQNQGGPFHNFCSWSQNWISEIFPILGEGPCPQTHIHHANFISHAPLGCKWLKIDLKGPEKTVYEWWPTVLANPPVIGKSCLKKYLGVLMVFQCL